MGRPDRRGLSVEGDEGEPDWGKRDRSRSRSVLGSDERTIAKGTRVNLMTKSLRA
jgi:hypothetical protein